MKPVLKWAGGKGQILPLLFEHFPSTMENYHEPFVGGGSVLLHLLEKIERKEIYVSKIYAYDNNRFLIEMYTSLQTHTEFLSKELKRLEEDYNGLKDIKEKEKYYYNLRNVFNMYLLEKVNFPLGYGSVLFIFINKVCFRGLYRVGKNGFNVPFGNYSKVNIDIENIGRVGRGLEGVVFQHCDFRETLGLVEKGDFVYLDPPYVPIQSSSFVSYTKEGFTEKDHDELFSLLQNNQFSFLLSNAAVPKVKERFLSSPFKSIEFDCKRRINSKNPESKEREILIWNEK